MRNQCSYTVTSASSPFTCTVTNKPNDIASNVKKNLAVTGAKIAKVKLNKDLRQCQSCGKDILSVNALKAIDLAIILRKLYFCHFSLFSALV